MSADDAGTIGWASRRVENKEKTTEHPSPLLALANNANRHISPLNMGMGIKCNFRSG